MKSLSLGNVAIVVGALAASAAALTPAYLLWNRPPPTVNYNELAGELIERYYVPPDPPQAPKPPPVVSPHELKAIEAMEIFFQSFAGPGLDDLSYWQGSATSIDLNGTLRPPAPPPGSQARLGNVRGGPLPFTVPPPPPI